MKSVFFLFILLLVFSTTAQENINYRLPSQEIPALSDFLKSQEGMENVSTPNETMKSKFTKKPLEVLL